MAKFPAGRLIALAEKYGNDEFILVAGGDTVAEAKGKRVCGKGCHHEAARSSHCHTV